jgi:hypothetical protein
VIKEKILQSIDDEYYRGKVSKMTFAKAAKYLGVVIGPEAAKQALGEPLQKYTTRGKRWAQLNIGLNWSIKMYNVFVFSVLSFMAQFYEPTSEVLKEEGRALRRLMPGPKNWISKEQLLTLSTWAGGGSIRDPSSIENVALAAKHRLVVSEPCFRDSDMIREINALKSRAETSTFLTFGESEWVNGGIVGGLLQANKEVIKKGASASARTIAEDRARKDGAAKKKKTQGKIQAETVKKKLKNKQGDYSIYETTAKAFKTWGGYQALVTKEPVFEKKVKNTGRPTQACQPVCAGSLRQSTHGRYLHW